MDMHTKLIFQHIQSTPISPAVKSLMKQGYYPTRHFIEIVFLSDRNTEYTENELASLNEDVPDRMIIFDPRKQKFVEVNGIMIIEEYGNSLMYAVSQHLPLSILRRLIRTGVDINATTKEHGSPLNVAISKNNVEAAKLLIACGAKLNQDRNRQPWFSPLHQAINQLNWEMVKLLVKSGANVNDLSEKGETPLNAVVWRESLPMVQLLLKAGACVNQRNASGVNALYTAMSNNKTKIAITLILAGANMNAICRPETDNSETPFSVAIEKNVDEDFIRILLKFGADTCLKIGHGYPVWHKAIHSDNCKSLKVLLKHPKVRLNLNEQCSVGMTAVHYAASYHRFYVLEQLLLAGARVDMMDNRQYTPLFYAVSYVKYPLALEDEPWRTRRWQRLPHLDCLAGPGCIELLLQHGADINLTFREGLTLLEIPYDPVFEESVPTILIKHLVLLESCKRPVNERFAIVINKCYDLRNIYKKCNAELQDMKETPIDTGISFWHFLVGSSTTVIRYLRNLRVRQSFKKILYEEKFSIYGDDLYVRFEITKKRGKQRRRAYKTLASLTNFGEAIIDNIFRFLPLRDLETLASIPRH